MPDLPSVTSIEAVDGQPHAMVNDSGEVFYPDDQEDARWFADEHEARPVDPDAFPFNR